MLCRVKRSGYVQIAGPVATKDTKKLCEKMMDYGARLILIDGAIDRKSIASPETSDAIILSTGAVLSRSLKNVVRETAHIVELYSLEELDEGEMRTLIESTEEKDRIALISGGEIRQLDLETGLGAGRYIDEEIDDSVDACFIPGALTESIINAIAPEKLRRTKFILKDPTKIFIDSVNWRKLVKKGFRVQVLKNIRVAAVTVNPFSPAGYSFNSQELVDEMQKALRDIPVIDVRK